VNLRRRLLPVVLAVTLAACSAPAAGPALTVAASSDPENVLLANIYAAGLRYYGTAARVDVVGDPLSALDTGKATVAAGFTGQLLAALDPDSQARSPESVYRAMIGALPEGIAAGDYAVAAEDKPALAVTEAMATAWGGRELTSLVRNCAAVRPGARIGVGYPTAVGDCMLPAPREFGTDAALFEALRADVVTAAWTTTADTGVPDGVVVLVDRKPALVPARNAVAIYRRNELGQMQLRAVNEIAGVLDTAALTEMLRTIAGGADPQSVAEQWLAANPLGR